MYVHLIYDKMKNQENNEYNYKVIQLETKPLEKPHNSTFYGILLPN